MTKLEKLKYYFVISLLWNLLILERAIVGIYRSCSLQICKLPNC